MEVKTRFTVETPKGELTGKMIYIVRDTLTERVRFASNRMVEADTVSFGLNEGLSDEIIEATLLRRPSTTKEKVK